MSHFTQEIVKSRASSIEYLKRKKESVKDAYVSLNIEAKEEGIFWREKLKDSDLLVEKWCSYHHLPKSSIGWGIYYVFEINLETRKNT